MKSVGVVLLAVTACVGVSAVQPVNAQSAAAQPAARTYSFNIPAGKLSKVLMAWAETAGYQYAWSDPSAQSLESPGVSGQMTAQSALTALTAGTGVTFAITGDRTVTIRKADKGQRVLAPVKVEGAVPTQSTLSGVNGSTDRTATENSGSYTTDALTIGGKSPRAMREIPQSVSVATRAVIEDQALTDVGQVLKRMAGISDRNPALGQTTYAARGFNVTQYSYDGGGVISTPMDSIRTEMNDTVGYDHVEVLRGSAGMFAGAGQPGGMVNLVRKRPLDKQQLTSSVQADSWGGTRAEVDYTTPIAGRDDLRVRAAVALTRSESFIDHYDGDREVVFLTGEWRVADFLTARVGYTYDHYSHTFFPGLPRYSTGEDLRLPRSFYVSTSWSDKTMRSKEGFVTLDWSLPREWTASVNLRYDNQMNDGTVGYLTGAVNPVTHAGARIQSQGWEAPYRTAALDANVRGSFDVFTLRQDLLVGIGSAKTNNNGSRSVSYLVGPNVDLFTFDPRSVPEPTPFSVNQTLRNENSSWGAYTTLTSHWSSAVTTSIGARVSDRDTAISDAFGVKRSPQNDPVVTPYAGVSVDLPFNATAYASYADIYTDQSSRATRDGDAAPPARGATRELGMKFALAGNRLNLTTALYDTGRQHVAVSDTSVPTYTTAEARSCCVLVIGKYIVRGAELELTGELRPGVQISASITHEENKYGQGFATEGQPFRTETPATLAKLWATGDLPKPFDRLRIGGGLTWQSSRFVAGSVAVLNEKGIQIRTEPYEFTQPAWAVADLFAEYRFNGKITAQLNVNNLFDKVYYSSVGSSSSSNFYGDPRNLRATVQARF